MTSHNTVRPCASLPACAGDNAYWITALSPFACVSCRVSGIVSPERLKHLE